MTSTFKLFHTLPVPSTKTPSSLPLFPGTLCHIQPRRSSASVLIVTPALPLYYVVDVTPSCYFVFYLSVLPLVKFCTTKWSLEVDPTIKNQESPKLSQ